MLKSLAVWLFVAGLATPLYAQPFLRLSYSELRRFAPGEFHMVDINARGQIAGHLIVEGVRRPVVWEAGQARVLPMLPLPRVSGATVRALNDAGDAVGYQGERDAQGQPGRTRAVFWPASGSVVDLGIPGNGSAFAVDVNNAGQVLAGTDFAQAFLWTAGGVVTIPTPPGALSMGVASINDQGRVAGTFMTVGGPACFLWSASAGTEVLASRCVAAAINNSETFVGMLEARPVLWTRTGGFQPLWGLEDHNGVVIRDLNDAGRVTGRLSPLRETGEAATFVWSAATGATMIGLNLRLAPETRGLSPNNELLMPDGRVLQIATERDPDVNGDGEGDLFWRGTDGALAIWLMRGGQLADGFQVHPRPASEWQVAGTADFNRDGYLDILWRSGRQLAIWYMRQGSLLDGQLLPSEADADWRIVGTGDANVDRWPDIYFQHVASGQIAIWLMSNAVVAEGVLSVRADAEALGLADVNGDRMPDLIFRGPNGTAAAVMQPRGAVSDWLALPALHDPLWRLHGAVDLNRDGRSDLIWQHADGRVAVWNMSRGTILDGFYLTGPMAFWQIAGPR